MRDEPTKQPDDDRRSAAPSASAAVRPDGLTEAEAAKQRTMKIVVSVLGLLILLAFAGVIAGMVYRASLIGKGSPAAPGKLAGLPAAARPVTGLQPDIKLSLGAGQAVKSTTLSGTHLVVHHEGPASGGIVILDLTTGQIVSRVTFGK